MLAFGLNQVTMSEAPLSVFLKTAADLGCAGVELRNDLDRALFDDLTASEAGEMVRDHGLRFLGLSQVYPFNRWSAELAVEVQALIDMAEASGAETISLIPCNDGTRIDKDARIADLTGALEACLPLLQQAGKVALVEPLGFQRASLRDKTETHAVIDALGAAEHFKLVHDTFHHTLAGGGPVFADRTGIVHISGVTDPSLTLDRMEDAHRVLVDAQDRLDNLGQIRALVEAGYTGAISFECFAPSVRTLADPVREIRESMNFISSHMRQEAA